jgi:site-specific recombinase XerD
MYISEALEDFLESLEVEGGRSKKTVENYRLYIERLVEFTEDVPVSKIDTELVRKYRLWLNRYQNFDGKELGRSTQAYHLIALRRFLTYLARRDIKSLEPSKIELPKVVKPQVNFLHYEEVKRLINAVPAETESDLRDRAIVELLFSSGLRVSELCNLNRDHINTKRREFMVRGKGNKDRPIFISKNAAEHIENYLEARNDNLVPLFINYSRRYKKPRRSSPPNV